MEGGIDRLEEGRKKLRAEKGLIIPTCTCTSIKGGIDRKKEKGGLIIYLNNGRDRQIEERNSKREGV